MAEFNISGVRGALKPMVWELAITLPPPALVLLVNPESLDIKFVPKITPARVRWTDRRESGYILHTHHDELDIISASGKSAMFYNDKGVTSDDRTRSKGWENIQRLIAIYKNNGMNFNSKPGQRGTNLIETVGRVVMTYDSTIYRGSFESFSVSETQEKPFNLEFSFDYKVTQMIDIRGRSNAILNRILQTSNPYVR